MIAVLGPGAGEIGRVVSECAERAGPGSEVRTVINDLPGSDMAASVKKGLAAVRGDASGVLVFPADHPLVSAETVRQLIAAHRACPDAIAIPLNRGRRGHPSLFPTDCLREGLREGRTLRDLVREEGDAVALVEVDDEGIVLDVDTMEDYRRILDIVRGGAQ